MRMHRLAAKARDQVGRDVEKLVGEHQHEVRVEHLRHAREAAQLRGVDDRVAAVGADHCSQRGFLVRDSADQGLADSRRDALTPLRIP
jgi:hypothetical protein